MYTHYYEVWRRTGFHPLPRRSYILIAHHTIFDNSTYKYYDEYDQAQDFSFYNFFLSFLPDLRGTRFYLKHRKLENSLRLPPLLG